MLRILLLTFKDHGNLGDQIIETCSRNLILSVLPQLGITDSYVESHDLNTEDDGIESFDLVIFGGGGLIKYKQQNFYETLPRFIDKAELHDIPVIFAGVGVEGYDPEDKNCLELQKSLNSPCIKQITTRDDLASLKRYIFDENIAIGKVLDSALFADRVFGKRQIETPRCIGLNVVRGALFHSYDIPWEGREEIAFWKSTAELLEEKGYEYLFFTNGLFSDEALLCRLRDELSLADNQVALDINCQDKLIDTISTFKAVIAFRLHASIIANAFDIPSVGLSWNEKVSFFYRGIGHPRRALPFEKWTAKDAVTELEVAMTEGFCKEKLPAPSLRDTCKSLYSGIEIALNYLAQKGRLDWKKPANREFDYFQMLEDLEGSQQEATLPEKYARAEKKIRDICVHYYKNQQALAAHKERNGELQAELGEIKRKFLFRVLRRLGYFRKP